MEKKIRRFVAEQKSFVNKQQQAEMGPSKGIKGISKVRSSPNRKGSGLGPLNVIRLGMDADGSTTVTFKIPEGCEKKKITEFRKGDIVSIGSGSKLSQNDKSDMEGLLLKISNTEVTVSVGKKDAIPEDWKADYTMWRLATDITYQRMLSALSELEIKRGRPLLHYVLFGKTRPQTNVERIEFINDFLNDSQKSAVTEAVNSTAVSLIQGPPGTGKTFTIVEIVRQLCLRGLRVLVCGPSNVSVDNLTEKLGPLSELQLVRIGHPARVLPSAADFCLDTLICLADEGGEIIEGRMLLEKAIKELEHAKNNKWAEINCEIEILRIKTQELEKIVATRIISESNVVLSTLCGSGSDSLSDEKFDVVIIDEASQAQEAECWIAAIKAPRLILVGDQHQLPPTIMLPNEEVETMFNRVKKMWPSVSRMLNVQYRMHKDIAQVSCDILYEGNLFSHHSVEKHLLSDFSHIRRTENTIVPLVLIDTAGARMLESEKSLQRKSANDNSKSNKHEAEIAVKHVRSLLFAGVPQSDIVVISPYNGQVRLIKLMIGETYPDVEVGSVDGFQGQEREVVVLSLVRSNISCNIGFLKDYRRMNVAVTRARRHLCIIADSATVSRGSKFLKELFRHLMLKGEVRNTTAVRSEAFNIPCNFLDLLSASF